MAAGAIANPSAGSKGSTSNESCGTHVVTTNYNVLNGDCSAVPENSTVVHFLERPTSLSVDWTRDEQALLEELLVKYASDDIMTRYINIAEKLQDKTVRDVALRCKWMSVFKKNGNGKQRKDNVNSTKAHKDKREKKTDKQGNPSSNVIDQANGHPYAESSSSVESDDDISIEDWSNIPLPKDIEGAGQLLDQIIQALDQISANFSALKVHENNKLCCQTRNSIATLLNESAAYMPQTTKPMQPLSVKTEEELNSVLS